MTLWNYIKFSIHSPLIKHSILWSIIITFLFALAYPPISLWPFGLLGFGIFVFKLYTMDFVSKWQPGWFFFATSFGLNVLGIHWISYTFNEFAGLNVFLSATLSILMFLSFSIISFVFGTVWGATAKKYRNWLVLLILIILWDFLDFRFFQWSPFQVVASDKYLLASVFKLSTWGWRILFYFCSLLIAMSFFYKNFKTKIILSFSVVFTFCFAYFLGVNSYKQLNIEYPYRQKVVLVQGNVGNNHKKLAKLGIIPTIENVLKIHEGLYEKIINDFAFNNWDTSAAWYFWPETAYPTVIRGENDEFLQNIYSKFYKLVNDLTGGVHLVGAYEADYYNFNSKNTKFDFNVIALINNYGELVDTYKKSIRIPFGEYIPGDKLWPKAYKYLPAVNHLGKGEVQKGLYVNLLSDTVYFPLICFEILNERYINRFFKKLKATHKNKQFIMVNPANDSWYGKSTEPRLHSVLARWQAARLGLPMVRPTNTGFSQVVAPWGEVLAEGPWFEITTIYGDLPVKFKSDK